MNIRELFIGVEATPVETFAIMKKFERLWLGHYALPLNCARRLPTLSGGGQAVSHRRLMRYRNRKNVPPAPAALRSGEALMEFFQWFGRLMVYKSPSQKIAEKAAGIFLIFSPPEKAEVPKIAYVDLEPSCIPICSRLNHSNTAESSSLRTCRTGAGKVSAGNYLTIRGDVSQVRNVPDLKRPDNGGNRTHRRQSL